jgi:hypothetical protein
VPCHSVAASKHRRGRTNSSAIAATFARNRHPTTALSMGLRHVSYTRHQHYDNRGCRCCVQLYVPDITLSLSTPPRQDVGTFSLGAVGPGSRTQVIHL